jgi:hypothetical protein
MVQLKFVSVADGEPIGVINWYAVHLTSMNKTNQYISSDNKGYAGLLFEAEINGPDIMPGKVRHYFAFSNVFNSIISNSRASVMNAGSVCSGFRQYQSWGCVAQHDGSQVPRYRTPV